MTAPSDDNDLMAWYEIEQYDGTGSPVADSRGDGDPTGPVVEALKSDPDHTVNVEIADDRHGRLLVASRNRWAIVGWTDLGDCNHQLVPDRQHQQEVEMYIGGVETRLDGAQLVPLADVELAVREFLTSGRGSLGLVWVKL